MSAQTRYRTLVANTGAIYSAKQESRTGLLQKGLDEIMAAIQPATSDQWGLVKTDSERLLKVWLSKEKEQEPASGEVVAQLLDLLRELSSVQPPALVIADKITHVHDFPHFIPVKRPEPVPAPVCAVKEIVIRAKEEVEEEEEEEVVEEEEEEVVEEEEEEEEEVVKEEEEEEEEEEAEEGQWETEEVEAEEDGMEVEQVFVRGRAYWMDSNTKKLYANAEGDEIGDEVGVMVNGKPQFLAK